MCPGCNPTYPILLLERQGPLGPQATTRAHCMVRARVRVRVRVRQGPQGPLGLGRVRARLGPQATTYVEAATLLAQAASLFVQVSNT